MQNYFFDVTDIMRYVKTETTISGIQRVSLEVVRGIMHNFGCTRVRLCFRKDEDGIYQVLDSDFLLEMEQFDAEFLLSVFYPQRLPLPEKKPNLLDKYKDMPIKRRYHTARANFYLRRWDKGFFKRRGTTLRRWLLEREGIEIPIRDPNRPIVDIRDVINPGDLLIILGATWGSKEMDADLSELCKVYGARISMLIHDLIPILTPEHLASGFSDEFRRWLLTSTQYCDRYFANSLNTGHDLRRFLREQNCSAPVKVISLAQQLDAQPGHKTDIAPPLKPEIRQEFLNLTKIPYVLVVGTIESRKNIWRLAQVWDRLSQLTDIDPPRLVLAGKAGWQNTDFSDWMKASGNLRGWIQIADRPTDDELAFLYQNCEFTAKVSLYEGWGLPIGESLSFGKTAVVANNSSMPEVGGDMVEYCDATSIPSMYDAFYKLITDRVHREMLEKRIQSTRLRTWQDVTEDFITALSDNETSPAEKIAAE